MSGVYPDMLGATLTCRESTSTCREAIPTFRDASSTCREAIPTCREAIPPHLGVRPPSGDTSGVHALVWGYVPPCLICLGARAPLCVASTQGHVFGRRARGTGGHAKVQGNGSLHACNQIASLRCGGNNHKLFRISVISALRHPAAQEGPAATAVSRGRPWGPQGTAGPARGGPYGVA